MHEILFPESGELLEGFAHRSLKIKKDLRNVIRPPAEGTVSYKHWLARKM
jgi:hypothetical protein